MASEWGCASLMKSSVCLCIAAWFKQLADQSHECRASGQLRGKLLHEVAHLTKVIIIVELAAAIPPQFP